MGQEIRIQAFKKIVNIPVLFVIKIERISLEMLVLLFHLYWYWIFLLPAGNLDWLLKCWQKWEIQFHKSGKSVSLKCEMDLNVSGQKMSAQVLKIEKGCFSKYLK